MGSLLELPPESSVVRQRRLGTETIVATVIFLVLSAGLYYFSWNHEVAGFLSDDAVYLLMADALSPLRPAEPGLTAYVMRETLFPPLYPLILAVLGAGSGSLLWAHLITTTTLVIALGVYGLWISSQVRDCVPAIGLVLVFALAPATLLQNLEILSEFPYLMVSLLVLWLTERATTSGRGHGVVALLVGLATLIRTAGLSLLVAFAAWLFRDRIRGRLKWLTLSIIPSLIWLACQKWMLVNKGSYTTFWSSLWERSQTNPRYVASFLEYQGKGLWQGLLATLDLKSSHLTQVMLGITLLLAFPVWMRRLWLGRLDSLYMLVGGLMILLYPFPAYFTRLFLPWVPIVLFYAYLGALGITEGWGRIRGKPALAYAYVAALLLTLSPSLGFISQRLVEPIDPELANWKHTRYWFRLDDMTQTRKDVRFRQDLINATREIATLVPEGNCVFGVHTAISMLYSRRIFLQPPPPAIGDSEFEKRSHACNYFFLVPVTGQLGNSSVAAFYPYDRLSADSVEVIRAWGDPRQPDVTTAVLLRSKSAP